MMKVVAARRIPNDRKHYGTNIVLSLWDDETMGEYDGDLSKAISAGIKVWLPYGEPMEHEDEGPYDDHYESRVEARVVNKIIRALPEEL